MKEMIMTTQQTKALKAEMLPMLPMLISTRRTALGRGLGALLMRARLGTAARQMPTLTVPKWAVGWEPEHQAFLKRVMLKSGGKRH
jgi:hypothetical protein